jgi:hypothetical protein
VSVVGGRTIEERPFEATVEAWQAGPVDEDDEERCFEELIEGMVLPEEAAREARESRPSAILPRGMSGREFTCSSCHLIMARSCLADAERGLCHGCAEEAAAGIHPEHRHSVERPCPVCGRVMLVPERPDAVCGYFCPGCGVHLRTRSGHRYLEWHHRYHSEAGRLADRTAPDPRRGRPLASRVGDRARS